MKNLKLFILLLSVSLATFSCGSDDDSAAENVLTFGDTEYQLKSGFITDYGEVEEGIYNFDVSILDIDIDITDLESGEGLEEVFTGIYFELFTDNSENLEEGIYAFGTDIEANSYVYADIYMQTADDNSYYTINSGTFTVLNNGTTYEFEFEGTTEDDVAFSGYYKGTLIEYSYSDEYESISTQRISKSRISKKTSVK